MRFEGSILEASAVINPSKNDAEIQDRFLMRFLPTLVRFWCHLGWQKASKSAPQTGRNGWFWENHKSWRQNPTRRSLQAGAADTPEAHPTSPAQHQTHDRTKQKFEKNKKDEQAKKPTAIRRNFFEAWGSFFFFEPLGTIWGAFGSHFGSLGGYFGGLGLSFLRVCLFYPLHSSHVEPF